MRLFTPRPYQREIMVRARMPRVMIWSFMGSGKTVSILTTLDQLDLCEPVFPALILAPKRVAATTWPEEVEKWEHLRHLRVSPIIGTPAQRAAAVAAPAEIYTINYEGLPWLIEHLGERWPFKTIVADESTRLKGYRTRQGGQRARALASRAFRSRRFIELTGTPTSQGLQDLWGQSWFIDQGERLGRSYTAFEDRWFKHVRMGEDAFSTKLVALPYSQKEIEDRLRDVCFSLQAKDHFDLREPIVTTINVELPPAARRIYTDMERKMYAELQSGIGVESFNAAAKSNRCQQIANGALYYDDKKSWEAIHDEKLDALESIIEEAAGMPVLVAYAFKHDLQRLLKRFPKGKQLDDNPKTIRDFNKGRIPVLFAHPKSCGHGLNLQDGTNILVFFGLDWNLEERLQIIERIGPVRQLQAGYDRPVFIYYIITRKTVDETIMGRVDEKKSVLECLMESMANR